jgi:hypothetical protein
MEWDNSAGFIVVGGEAARSNDVHLAFVSHNQPDGSPSLFVTELRHLHLAMREPEVLV